MSSPGELIRSSLEGDDSSATTPPSRIPKVLRRLGYETHVRLLSRWRIPYRAPGPGFFTGRHVPV